MLQSLYRWCLSEFYWCEKRHTKLKEIILQAVMREFDSRYIDGVLDGAGQYQLDVDVNSITFTHHHLFSKEHVVAARLSQLFQQYTTRRQKNMVNFLTDKVNI